MHTSSHSVTSKSASVPSIVSSQSPSSAIHTLSRSVFPEIASVPPVAPSDLSQSVFPKNANHPVPVQVLEGHENTVLCVCFCTENKVVSGSVDHTLRIWDRKTGTTQVLSGHADTVWEVDVSQDGKMVVSSSADCTVRIWDGESGEMMQVCRGHGDEVYLVKFSPDSSRIVSGSEDNTIRVWSVETGEQAFEPIKCHGRVDCVRYSPGGDRIASGSDTVHIWNAETGVGILSIRNSKVGSLAWTADGTHIIGGGRGEFTIWNSDDGEKIRTWKAHDGPGLIRGLSLSPTAPTHLATSSWDWKTTFIFDISTGKQVAALEHNQIADTIAFSPSGRHIVTACHDKKLYLWEAPAFGDPQTKPPTQPFSSLLDRPAIPLAGPSQNDGRGLDPFWDSLPNRAQEASPQPQRLLNKARNAFANIFTRRPAGAARTLPIPQGPARETVEPVEVAAGRDKTFWVIVAIPTYTTVEKILYTIIHCRKPEDPDDDLPAATGTNSSEITAGNAATTDPSEPAGDSVIRTQPQCIEMPAVRGLSGVEKTDRSPGSLQTSAGKTVMRNQRESIEMVAFPHSITQNLPASPLSNTSRPTSSQALLQHDHTPPSAITLSPIEIAMIEEYRRRQATSAFIETVADPLSGASHDRDALRSP
ncbi:hypothetical protein PAXINDRAFT_14055 [Paxillus involutus ATCC 200175]|uniref:WD40 repeat-like protein n=1 Tax=Paxillus involutus ATCC 200175 TaxID=664439 RepID=A0A0C9TS44_PAXIN|nr:hypothetical protein PAXINDRAFT_14055 [Paxillus involutus ATCC 200175]